MLGRPRVGDGAGRVEVVDEDVAGLVGERGLDSLAVPGGRELAVQLVVDPGGQARVGGDQQAGGQLVVLGLADQVGGDEGRVGGVVGDDPISVGPFSPSMPTTPVRMRLAAAT